MAKRTRNIYYVHDDGSCEILCGNDTILIDRKFVKLVSAYQWSIGSHGYVISGSGKNQLLLHRIIIGAKAGENVDHINQKKLDNRLSNLRIVTTEQNSINRPKQINNTSGYKGVCKLSDNTWQAQIQCKGESTYLGKYPEISEAALAYDLAAKILFGEYAHLNYPDIPHQEDKKIISRLQNKRKNLTLEQAKQIRILYENGLSIKDLSQIFNRSYSAIHRIINRKTFIPKGGNSEGN